MSKLLTNLLLLLLLMSPELFVQVRMLTGCLQGCALSTWVHSAGQRVQEEVGLIGGAGVDVSTDRLQRLLTELGARALGRLRRSEGGDGGGGGGVGPANGGRVIVLGEAAACKS